MHQRGLPEFPYYVGISSLDQIATREDRVCVLNILGNESRSVTPTSHAFSGGNVVFGTAPGHGGEVLETPAGPIPVFDNVRAGLSAGHAFDTGVVYLPPAAVRHGVYELVRVNRELRKIVIITEKVPVHDARAIRAVSQQLGIDVFGANSLGVADSWSQVRIGGALGGDAPGETLLKGSIAVLSNSGNFTTTIAGYLAMAGWGTTTLISSGKDHYIYYASPEWAHAFGNDARSKAAVMYVEPGGYYERGLRFPKPVVACVVGRWKEKLTRPVGHAGAISGSGNAAADKERWFAEALEVEGMFTPERPVVSTKGALVNNIAYLPAALDAVMALHGVEHDFAPRGSLALKPWFANDQGLALPEALQVPVVEALAPYGEQIAKLNLQVGATFPRARMKDASGASRMDPESHVSSLHGVPVLEAGRATLASNMALALLREPPGERGEALVHVAVAAHAHLHGDPVLAAVTAARDAGSAPSAALAAGVAIVGPRRVARARRAVDAFVDAYAGALDDPQGGAVDASRIAGVLADLGPAPGGERGAAMRRALDARGASSAFVDALDALGHGEDEDLLLGALAATLVWRPLRRRRISRDTARGLPWVLRLYGTVLGATLPAAAHGPDSLAGVPLASWLGERTLTDLALVALTGAAGPFAEPERVALRMLVGLLLTNGPGTISAQGAKGAVAADGPETPGRVQWNKAMVGYLSHTGFSHGGAGFEGIRFLQEAFAGSGLEDPGAAEPGVDVEAIARAVARRFAAEKAEAKAVGAPVNVIPGINHPVFRGKPENHDPREVFIHGFFAGRGEANVFHDFYRTLVRVLHDEGVTRNIFAVNIDAVIAAALLKTMWPRRAALAPGQLEDAAFHLFVFGRMIGCAAEVDDHLNRGRNMDTRTPASGCRHVS